MRHLCVLLQVVLTTALGGCGGGSGPDEPLAFKLAASDRADASPSLASSTCLPGSGTDHQVGPASGQLSSLEAVPWESLKAGDTVRIFYRAAPYRSKFLIAGRGDANQPIRVCGVAGPNGERPVIDGANALTRAQLNYSNDTGPNGLLHQTRSVIVIKPLGSQPWRSFPAHIRIDGLEIRGANPGNTFTDNRGAQRRYVSFGACIWIERGHDIRLENNLIHDCTNGVFSKSTDDALDEGNPSEFSVTKDILLAGNAFYGNGVANDYHQHNTYIQSVNVVYEFNRYGPLRSGALGSALKDRSVNAVVRYNRIEGGARSLDLVEAEDYPRTATANPAYRETFVYGNQLIKDGRTGIAVHYGGDHAGAAPGSLWGEPIFRKGTLYFFNNTLVLTGNAFAIYVFQISTTEERGEIWNNVILFRDAVTQPSLRAGQEVGSAYVTGGVINLGRNWINHGWRLHDEYHPVPGPVFGAANMLTASVPPIDAVTLIPWIGGQAIDAAQAGPAAAAAYSVDQQLNPTFMPEQRVVNGAALDLGALER
jgi:hypothetical protein